MVLSHESCKWKVTVCPEFQCEYVLNSAPTACISSAREILHPDVAPLNIVISSARWLRHCRNIRTECAYWQGMWTAVVCYWYAERYAVRMVASWPRIRPRTPRVLDNCSIGDELFASFVWACRTRAGLCSMHPPIWLPIVHCRYCVRAMV